jgi:cation diffusion facilitator CzcD-associated flavoprotein CzcO
MKKVLRAGVARALPEGYDVDTHFNPRYGPWDQRLCLVPDGDLFKAISAGKASVATDAIQRFTPGGVLLASGQELPADIIVTATGLNLLALGGIELVVDGAPVSLPERMAYKGMMLSRVPNFAFTIGYTNASWTLKADLVAEYVCRVLAHMDAHGYRVVQPVDDDPRVERVPLLDFEAGYVQRSLHLFPKGGSRAPWKLGMSYANDVVAIRHGGLEDGALRFATS